MRGAVALIAVSLSIATARSAYAAPSGEPLAPPTTEIQFAIAAGGEGSSWHGDGAGFVGIKAGVRFLQSIAPYFLARAGYANTDQRVLELIQIGAQLWIPLHAVQPYLRLGMLHQHEESWAGIQGDVPGALVGIGDGIRHRFGGEFALGLDIPFKRHKHWQFYASVEGLATVFPPDQKGPRVYGGRTLGIGFNYGL